MDLTERHLLVIDLEATCWAVGDVVPGPHEIIEIGLTVLSPAKEELWSGGWFVRPVVCPRLSEFCTALTSIRQAEVDGAGTFPQVLPEVERKIVEVTGRVVAESLFVSWGNYDRKQLQQDCVLHGYPYPFGEHWNVKQAFMRAHRVKKMGLDAACRFLGLPMVGTHHRGRDDALNIARVVQKFGG